MKENQTFAKLGKNIKGLRRAYGQTLEQLAYAVNVQPNTISQYETGARIPKLETLIKIAKHFNVTESDLIHEDFTQNQSVAVGTINNGALARKMLPILFPIVCSDEALENENFRMAYESHLQWFENPLDDANISALVKCESLYKKAEKEGIREATANAMHLDLIYGMFLVNASPRLIEKLEEWGKREEPMKNFLEFFLRSFTDKDDPLDTTDRDNAEYDSEAAEWKEEKHKDFMVSIARLKKSSNYAELGDYYLALMYIFGIINNGRSREMNIVIGSELMWRLYILLNPYAKKLYDKV